MTTFSDPMDSANELADQVRALAHATRSFEGKAGDTYWVLGSLLAANRRMQQVYAQLATAHVTHQDLAHTDAGNALQGRAHAHNAAMALRRAVALLGKVDDELGEASIQSGRIAWYPPAPPASPQPRRALEVEITADGDGLDLGAHREAGGPGLNA